MTALFNPTFLVLLLILYFIGKFLGKLTVRMNIWKFLLFAYFAVFLFDPVRNLGLWLGLVFFAGFFSNHLRRLPSIIAWAQDLSDLYFAYKHKEAFEEIREAEAFAESERRRSYERAYKQDQKERDEQSHQQKQWEAERDRRRYEEQKQRQRDKDHPKSDEEIFKAKQAYKAKVRRYYEVLGLTPGAPLTERDLKWAFRKKAKQVHPDVGGTDAQFVELQEAFDELKNHISV